MTKNKLEPRLDLTKDQALKLIKDFVSKNDPNELFEHILNTLMKSERDAFLEDKGSPNNKGNGYRKVSKLGMHKKLQLIIPRDRLSLFKPLVMGLLNTQEEKMKELTYRLYGEGLTTSQIGGILENVYGEHYGKSTISRINQSFHQNIEAWFTRALEERYLVVMIDALYIKVKRDRVASEPFYVVLGLNKHFKREILAVVNQPTESASGWENVLKGLKERGVKKVGLFVSDNLKGLDTSIDKVFPKSDHQKCVVHLKRNILGKIRKNLRAEVAAALASVFDLETSSTNIKDAVENCKSTLKPYTKKYPSLSPMLETNYLERYFTYLKYDRSIRNMIYTTNWIERFNKTVRRTTKIRNSLPSPHAALMLIGYTAMEVEEGAYKYSINKFANDKKINELAHD